MIARVLRWASTVAALILILSFGLFALDEARAGSERQVQRLEDANRADPGDRDEAVREREHSAVREVIDDANDVLVKPFADVVKSDDIWVQRGVPTLIAFLLFGVALRILANYLRG